MVRSPSPPWPGLRAAGPESKRDERGGIESTGTVGDHRANLGGPGPADRERKSSVPDASTLRGLVDPVRRYTTGTVMDIGYAAFDACVAPREPAPAAPEPGSADCRGARARARGLRAHGLPGRRGACSCGHPDL